MHTTDCSIFVFRFARQVLPAQLLSSENMREEIVDGEHPTPNAPPEGEMSTKIAFLMPKPTNFLHCLLTINHSPPLSIHCHEIIPPDPLSFPVTKSTPDNHSRFLHRGQIATITTISALVLISSSASDVWRQHSSTPRTPSLRQTLQKMLLLRDRGDHPHQCLHKVPAMVSA